MRFLDFQIGAMAMIWLTRGPECFDDSLSDPEFSEHTPILIWQFSFKERGLNIFKNSATSCLHIACAGNTSHDPL